MHIIQVYNGEFSTSNKSPNTNRSKNALEIKTQYISQRQMLSNRKISQQNLAVRAILRQKYRQQSTFDAAKFAPMRNAILGSSDLSNSKKVEHNILASIFTPSSRNPQRIHVENCSVKRFKAALQKELQQVSLNSCSENHFELQKSTTEEFDHPKQGITS